MTDSVDQAWAAGLFDAEGSCSTAGDYPAISMYNTDRTLLVRFSAAVEAGSISGPYTKTSATFARRPQWAFKLYRISEAHGVMHSLWPWLSEPKKRRWLEVAGDPFAPSDGIHTRVEAHRSSGNTIPAREALAWAAGFFDGEGCFSHPKRSSMVAQITSTDRDILARFHKVIRQGKIYGPYRYETTFGNNKERWVYTSRGYENVQHVLGSLWFRLGRAKREKARAILLRYRTFYACGHPRETDRPWHKHCPDCFKPGPKPKSRSAG